MSYLSKLIEQEIDKLNASSSAHPETDEEYREQVHKCFRLTLDYFKYHDHEERSR